jgi:hypothetical protein
MSVTTIRLEADDEDEGFTYNRVIKHWILNYLDADDYQHQLAYMKRVSKPISLNGEPVCVHQFSQRLRVILKRMTYFPTAPDTAEEIMTPEEFNYTFFYAMPSAWQQKRKEKGGTPFSQTPIKELIKHFQVLWESEQESKNKLTEQIQYHTDDRNVQHGVLESACSQKGRPSTLDL